jgi:signal peptidase I
MQRRSEDVQQNSKEEKSDKTMRPKGEGWKIAGIIFRKLLVTGLLLWAVFTFVFGLARISGESMYPRLRDGDLILYYRLDRNYSQGEVVTFRINGNRRTARVVATGGDVVDITEEGQLLVNGNVQEEEIFYPTEKASAGITYPCTVEEGSYFVLCDFRTASTDSRDYGTISGKDISGKVITLLRRRGI